MIGTAGRQSVGCDQQNITEHEMLSIEDFNINKTEY